MNDEERALNQLRVEFERMIVYQKQTTKNLNKIALIVEKLSANAVRMDSVVRRIESLENDRKWTIRTVLGVFATSVVGAFTALKIHY